MFVEGYVAIFMCGMFGGSIGELLKWYRIRTQKKLPEYAKSPIYWIITILIIICGGVLAILYGGGRANAIMVVHIGFSAPLLIENLSKTLAPIKSLSNAVPQDTQRESGLDLKNYIKNNNTVTILEFLKQ